MAFANYVTTLLLGTATLLLLALYTLTKCRAQLPTRPTEYSVFLFQGHERRHSLAATIGSTFSVTYYGATTIYGHLYRGWFILLLAAGCILSLFLIGAVIREAHAAGVPAADSRSNLLLNLLRVRLGQQNTQHLVRLWIGIYVFLLAEELAVSRVVLMTVFAQYPAVPAVLIATMCIVVSVYVRWGGFKAILIADYEQIKLLLPFAIALGFVIFRGKDLSIALTHAFVPIVRTNVAAFPLGVLLMVSWKVAAVDMYSRLNFRMSASKPVEEQRLWFAVVAVALAVGMFVIVAFFGMTLPSEFSHVRTPVGFTRAGLQYAAVLSSKPALVIFVASLFSMILTTINTLAMTTLQLGAYQRSGRPHIRDLSRLFLVAVLLSCFFDPNAVSGVGMFVGALLIIPLLAIISAISGGVRRLLPHSFAFVGPSALVAAVAFMASYRRIGGDYAQHYLLPVLVVSSFVLCASVGHLVELRRAS
jgi:hypothetical protein